MAEDRFHLAGVMGWPVMHSRSPLMHNYWMAQQGLKGAYLPLAIRPGLIEGALRGLHPLGFAGCNVTIPHKRDAMRICDEVDEVARMIGAVSCVAVRDDGTLFATNNDWRGFLGNLRDADPGWTGAAGPAVVLGAGGGARAVAYALLQEGAPEIRLVNRTPEHAQAVAADLGGPIKVLDWQARHEALSGAACLVNTTSLGMVGQPALELDLERLDQGALVADIVYTPLETELLAAARRRGNRTVGGLGMLLHQGPPAWKLWFGLEPRVTPELHALMRESILAG